MRAIFDASVFVRALADEEPTAAGWLARAREDVDVSVPSLVFAEVGDALARYVRAAGLTAQGAADRLALVLRVPKVVVEVGELAPAAFAFAVARGVSVYDACYAVLAEAEDAILVTADRRLASAVSKAELV